MADNGIWYCAITAAGIQTTQYTEQFVIMFTLVMTQLKQVYIIHTYFTTCVYQRIYTILLFVSSLIM